MQSDAKSSNQKCNIRVLLLALLTPSRLTLCITFVGEKDIPNLTDTSVPRRLGPKRASRIRKLFNLNKEDDVRQYVVRRPLPEKEGKSNDAFLKSTH